MPEDISIVLNSLLKDSASMITGEAVELFNEAKEDSEAFVRRLADRTQKNLLRLAEGKLTRDEFEEIMGDQLELAQLLSNKLQSDAKVSAQRLVNGIKELVIDKVLSLI